MPAIENFSMEPPSGRLGQNSNLKVLGPSQAKIAVQGTLDDGAIMVIHATMTHTSHPDHRGIYVWIGRKIGPPVNGFTSFNLDFVLFMTTDGQVDSGSGVGGGGPQGVTVAVTVTNSNGDTGAANQPVTVE
jgi:hypothetical protein